MSESTTKLVEGIPFGDEIITSFRVGNLTFTLLWKDPEQKRSWLVQISSPGQRLGQGKLNPTLMSEERIIKLYEDQLGHKAANAMSTVGERAGKRAKIRNSRPRMKYVFTHSGRIAAAAVAC